MNNILTLTTQANQDTSQAANIIKAAYRQVFGNRYLMELDVCTSIESLFMNGDLTVQGLVTALAQSESYRRLYLETNSPYRFVELNFKHLLGRPPNNQQEISDHVTRLAEEGFESEIASYTYSAEYLKCFGINTVPYTRTNISISGQKTITFNRTKAFDPGYAGFDGSKRATLLTSIAANTNPAGMNVRKSAGTSGRYNISWVSMQQPATVNRSQQRSLVSYSSLSATIRSIQAQGGKIVAINAN
jgi:phycoerythrin-associated linker protein